MDVVGPSRNSGQDRGATLGGSPGRRILRQSGETSRRLVQFGAVGAVGTVVNTMVFAAATEAGLPHLIAAFLSMEIATGFNFAVSERTVFVGRGSGRRWVRMASFFAVATSGFLVTGPLTITLIAVSVSPIVANVLAIGTLMVGRFLVADRLIWPSGHRSGVAGR